MLDHLSHNHQDACVPEVGVIAATAVLLVRVQPTYVMLPQFNDLLQNCEIFFICSAWEYPKTSIFWPTIPELLTLRACLRIVAAEVVMRRCCIHLIVVLRCGMLPLIHNFLVLCATNIRRAFLHCDLKTAVY